MIAADSHTNLGSLIYGNQSDTILVKSPPPRLRHCLVGTSAVFGILFALTALLPMTSAVIGTGQVGVETSVVRISHPTGGVVSEVLVKNGQHVEKGQLLMRLDNQVSRADAAYSSLTVEQLLAQKARLEAERAGTGTPVFPLELQATQSDSAKQAIADENRLFQIRQQESAQMRAQFHARVKQAQENINAVNAQISSLQAQRKLIEPELSNMRELWKRRLVTISRINQMERAAIEIDGSIAGQKAQISQLNARIAETDEQRVQLISTRRSQAGEELARINTILNDHRMRQVVANDQNTRSEIRAPRSGVIERIAFPAIGEVIRSAEPIMSIVPDNDKMVLESSISLTDIDQVRADQTARIRFSSFNQAKTPEILGRVVYVAADRSTNPGTQQQFYLVRIEIDQAGLRKERLALRSGMPAEVFIQTGSRSMLSYLTKPLNDQFSRAFRNE